MRAVTLDASMPRAAPSAWRQSPAPARSEEELWMQNDDVASAWTVSALTGAAVALLLILAVLG